MVGVAGEGLQASSFQNRLVLHSAVTFWGNWMKAILRLTGLLFVLMTVVAGAHAADLTGTWKGAFDYNGNAVPVTLNLTNTGSALSGTMEGLPTSPVDIHDGKVDGDKITFWINTDYEGTTYKLLYNGKMTTDQIDFSFGTEDGSWGTTLTVKRDVPVAPPPFTNDVTGVWKGEWDFNGTATPVTFNLKSSESGVTGTVEGMGPAPVDIHDGKIEGDTVTFWLNTDYQGQTYALTYKGKITAGQIDFTFGTADGSWGAAVTAKKS